MAASPRLLLIGWDGAEWNLIAPLLDAGKLPNLAKLVENGVLAKLGSLSPVLSAPLWTSVATGRRPEVHGICGNVEPAGDSVTPISARWRQGSTLWEIVARAGRPAVVVDWPASLPCAEMPGLVVAGGKSAVPARLADDVTELRVEPSELSRDDLRPFVAGADQLDPAKEPPLAMVMSMLAAAVGTQAVAGYLLENEPWTFAAVNFATPAEAARGFIDYMAPRLPQVTDTDFARYTHVVEQTLVLHDQLLARLLTTAGPDCTVIITSNHGWLTGARRPILEPGEHAENLGRERPQGWTVLRGPGLKADELIYGGTLLDLAPTILWRLGLPVPKDWPGKAWYHAAVKPEQAALIGTVEHVPPSPPAYLHADTAGLDELRYLHANYLLNAGRVTEAVPLLEAAHRALEPRIGPALLLITAYLSQRRFAEASALLENLAARPEGGLRGRAGRTAKFPPQFEFMRGMIAEGEGRLADAQRHFEGALGINALTAEPFICLGRVHLAVRRPRDAREAFGRGLELDPENSSAHYGLAVACYRLRDFAAAADHALEASSRRTEPPEFHLLLGLALGRIGQREQAVVALRHALARQPALLLAHRALVVLHKKNPTESVLAETHRQAARAIRLRLAAK